jgi:hypothetical protein
MSSGGRSVRESVCAELSLSILVIVFVSYFAIYALAARVSVLLVYAAIINLCLNLLTILGVMLSIVSFVRKEPRNVLATVTICLHLLRFVPVEYLMR